MGCGRHWFKLSAFTCLFLLSTFRSSSLGSDKVTVSLYYESLCPYCADFIVNHLVKVFDKGLISIVNLRLIPWGNSWIGPDGSFTCQHGPDECMLNTVQACAISIYPDVNRHFKFIHCLEQLTLENRHDEWTKCFKITQLGTSPINCYKSGRGKLLAQKYASETARLNPPHRFVPWLVVNNQAIQEDFQNFIHYICKAYRGSHVPEACRSIQQLNDLDYKEYSNPINQVCYASLAKNVTS